MYCILHVICTWVAVTLIRNTIGFLCHFIPFSWKTKLINSLIMYQQCGWIVRTSDYAICVDQWQLMRRLRGLSSIATPLLIVARFSQIFLVRMGDLQGRLLEADTLAVDMIPQWRFIPDWSLQHASQPPPHRMVSLLIRLVTAWY